MLSEEEKKAIEKLKETQDSYLKDELDLAIETVLNLITKLQKENKEKDKQIDLMAEYIANRDNDEDICKYQVAEWCEDEEDGVLIEVCRKCIKQYFERKCEE